PVDPAWAGLCPPSPLEAPSDLHYDPATAEAGPDWRAEAVADFVSSAQESAASNAPKGTAVSGTAAGFCETVATERYFANSLGHAESDRYTRAGVDGILRMAPPGTPGPDGVGSSYSWRRKDVDAAASGTGAGFRAARGLAPVELPAGRYEVVLEPRCVAYILDFLLVYGFNARAVLEGRSFVS